MALETVGEQPMLVVTVDASLLAMGISHLFHLGFRLRMTGDTGCTNVLHIGQGFAQRRMGRMTTFAILKGKVGILLRQMTTCTSRRGAVLLRQMLAVAAETADLVLVRLAIGLQLCHDLAMTGRTQVGGDACKITNRPRVVRRVAALAIGFNHGLRVGDVATGALRRITMGQVTLVAGQVGMKIGDILLDNHHPFVATETGPLDLPRFGEIELQRAMGMVAGSTILQSVMRLVSGGMAQPAIHIGLFPFTGMLLVAFMAGDLGLVSATVPGKFFDDPPVAGRAGPTGLLHIGQGGDQGRMGSVAVGTITDGEMRPLGRGVAVGTSRNGTVFFMAAGATHFLMSASLLNNGRSSFLVAGATQSRSDVCRVMKVSGRVGGMASEAIFVDHRFAVRLMTVKAGHRLTVLWMTLTATAEFFFMCRA